MNEFSRRIRAFAEGQGRSWVVRSVLVVILLFSIAHGVAWWSTSSLDRDRERILAAEASERLSSAVAEFARVQDGLLAIARRAASLPPLGAALNGTTVRREDLFAAALRVSEEEEVGI